MCKRVACPKCQKPTWAGCGLHIDQALAGVIFASLYCYPSWSYFQTNIRYPSMIDAIVRRTPKIDRLRAERVHNGHSTTVYNQIKLIKCTHTNLFFII